MGTNPDQRRRPHPSARRTHGRLIIALLVLFAGCTAHDARDATPTAPDAPAPTSGTARERDVAIPKPVATPPAEPSPRRTYVIAHPPHLEPSARRWAAHRRDDGWTVHVEEIAPDSGDAERSTAAEAARGPAPVRAVLVRRMIEHRYRAHRDADGDGEAFAILLLGDAGPAGIPSWPYRQLDPMLIDQRDPGYVGDHAYQRLDGDDELPDVPLGRVPARSVEEADALLEKIARYERAAPRGPWRRRVNYVAGEGRFGGFDLLIEMMFMNLVDRGVPDAYDVSLTYAKPSSIYCPPPELLTDTLLRRLGEGSLFFNYVGHGSERGFDRLDWSGGNRRMLELDDLAALEGASADRPVALLTCCSAGWFDLPYGETSLGEAMLFHPAGPVAVIAGSRPTHPYANTVFQKDVTRLLLVDRAPTIGEVDLHATRSLLVRDEIDQELDAIVAPIAAFGNWRSSLTELRHMHAHLYNLLGDPALRIAYPDGTIEDLALHDRRVTGRVPGMARGVVTVTIERGQVAMPETARLRPMIGPGDPDFPAKAAHNYPIANQRVIEQLDVSVRDGWFEGALRDRPPSRAAILKGYAVGTDADGAPFDAFGSIPLMPIGHDKPVTPSS